eukprot:4355287-Karenia_brevis.AAC.1
MDHDHDGEEHQQSSIHQESNYLRKIENFQHQTAVKIHLQKFYQTKTKTTEKFTQLRRQKLKRVDIYQSQGSM